MGFLCDFLWYSTGVILALVVYLVLVEVTCAIYFKNKLNFMEKFGNFIKEEKCQEKTEAAE